ncbi:MAG: acyl-CoA dehydrogenase family protein [Hyphomicrobiales bacterium]
MPDKTFLDWPFFEPRHRELAAAIDNWAANRVDRLTAADDEDDACRSLVRELGEAGFLKHAVVAPHGGADARLDVRSLCIIRETLSRHHGLADFAFAMQGLGSGPICLAGSDDQQARFLPQVAAGEALAAFALTEPDAGSDAGAIALSAEPGGGGFVLNGEKTWISNGGIAAQYIVFARTGEAPGARGLSAFIVPADTPGLGVAERLDVIAPHPLARLLFEDCEVPRENLIGEGGQGFKIAMATLDVFRSTVGAAALGFARRAMDEAVDYASARRIGNAAIADMQIPQAKIADMATSIDAAALLIYRAAWAKDQGAERVTREASMAKLFATESAQRVIDDAVQLHGGLGVKKGVKVEELYRDIRALRIYEGASEVQKLVIARQALNNRMTETS